MINRALELAAKAHAEQKRKGTEIPYITHPCAVAIILGRAGCDDEVIAAGLLHDTIEDAGILIEDIKFDFGNRVAEIVNSCSEPDKSLSWEERKEHTIQHLSNASTDIKYVACADKLHNLSTIAAGLKTHGTDLWCRFNRGQDSQAWYYRGVVNALGNNEFSNTAIYGEFSSLVKEVFGTP